MKGDTRLDRLFPALAAKERALAVLKAWKEGGDEDRLIRATMPDRQVAEFNRYIAIMNGVNERLGPWVLLLRANVEQLGLVDAWLATMRLWSIAAFELGSFIFLHVPEPITETECASLKRTSRRRQPKPDWGRRFEVVTDARAKEVEKLREERSRVWDVLRRAPTCDLFDYEDPDPPKMEETYRALLDRLVRQVSQYWLELRAVEILLEAAAEEFGEDAAMPEVRGIVDWLRAELTVLHKTLKTTHRRETELPEPDEVHLERTRQVARWPEDAVVSLRINASGL